MVDSNFKFESFEEFCSRADELLKIFKKIASRPDFKIQIYQDYIYKEHTFSENKIKDMRIKDKCWTWLMSYKYEKMSKNDLYCTLGMINKKKRRK